MQPQDVYSLEMRNAFPQELLSIGPLKVKGLLPDACLMLLLGMPYFELLGFEGEDYLGELLAR